LKPNDSSKDISVFAEAEITFVQYILFTLEENAIHQRSKPENPSTVPNPHRFGPPTGTACRHRWKEEKASHLHTGDNRSKTSTTTLSKTYHGGQKMTSRHEKALSKAKGLISLLAPIKYY
jgi:hypothetical protein